MLDGLLQYVPAELHRAYLGLLVHVPRYAKRVAVVGRSGAALGVLLKRRGVAQVIGVTGDAHSAAVAGQTLDDVIQAGDDLGKIPDRSLDVVLLCNLEGELSEACEWLARIAPKIGGQGLVCAMHGNPSLAGSRANPDRDALEARLADGLQAIGYQRYLRHDVDGAGFMHVAVSHDYNPILHTRALVDGGDPESAFQVLESIPPVYLESGDARRNVNVEMLDVLARCIAAGRGGDRSMLLSRAQDLYYSLVDEFPRMAEAYQLMARCWELAGNPAMARRLLRTIQHVAPAPGVAAQLGALGDPPAPHGRSVEAPAWSPQSPFRVLFLVHPRPHFGLDGLYDGLCACLGDENVVDFPWKPTLHGREMENYKNYPCRFDRGGIEQGAGAIAEAVRLGAFDAILYGDIEGDIPFPEVQTILEVRGACPLYLVDAMDQMGNYRELARQRLGVSDFAAYFKREMLAGEDYGPNTYPCPFSYTPPEAPPVPYHARPEPFFWAGHRSFGQRRIYLETLEAHFGWDLNTRFEQAEYRRRLQHSRIGLNCFGMGFDTVRYWELPAHGCLMVSENLPIHIPFNFEAGKHAVFFDDLPELMAKLTYYQAHPEEAAAIARAGYEHFLAHHTNEARARQVLGWIQASGAP